MSGILVIRLRSDIHVRTDMSDTMKFLNLTRVNHATIVPDNPVTRGMLRKVKDWVTFGAVDAATAAELLQKRGRLEGNKPVTDAFLKENSDHASIQAYAEALASGKARLGDVPGMKPLFRLAPPRQGHEGIKHSFRSHGALGDRGEAIGALATRMV